MEKSNFEKLAAVNVNEHTEKKGQFTYLSWPFAVSEISKADPNVVFEYPDPVTYKDGTMMVFANVTAFGKTMRAFLPVMDNKNRAITDPNSFDVNKAMQRCLVKGIALHGLGLYIYSGEDLPEEESRKPEPKKLTDKALADLLAAVSECGTKDELHVVRDLAKKTCEDANDAAAYGAIVAAVKTRVAELAKKEAK